jgi:flagellar biosynthesis/type III secretory pathway M-ring protein FliF/YscJ
MRKRSLPSAWKMALAVFALAFLAMALYVQLVERRSRREADRLAAARLEEALEESRSNSAELARRRSELMKEPVEPPGDQPLPDAVLRRRESGKGSDLQQVRDSQDEQQAVLARVQESIDLLALQTERSDQALRRDVAAIRAEVRREQDASNKILSLLLAALVPLVLHLLTTLQGDGKGDGDD